MATTTETMVDGGFNLQFVPGIPPKLAFGKQEELASNTSTSYDDLRGNVPIYAIWLQKFSEDGEAAHEEWKNFRQDTLDRYNDLDRTLRGIEDELNMNDDLGHFLDLSVVLEEQSKTEVLYTRFEQNEETFTLVTKLLEEFSTFLPREGHRHKVDAMNRILRRRFFEVLEQLHRRKRLFRWLVPRLRRYRTSGSEVKIWLDKVESLAESFVPDSKGSVIHLEGTITELVNEALDKKNLYEDFVAGGKGMETVRVELNQTFGLNLKELELDLDDVMQRWDAMCATLEFVSSEITKEKSTPKKTKKIPKTDAEKIDMKLEEEVQLCTCENPFKIHKVGDGKYTFGSSKIIRLVRIHGQSIVVRVGGGWEYVYNFLMKVDPCRAQEFAPGKFRKTSNVNEKIQATGVTLTPLDKEESTFTMSVQRLRVTSVPRSIRSQSTEGVADGIDGDLEVSPVSNGETSPQDKNSNQENASFTSPPETGRKTPSNSRRPSSPAPCRSNSCKANTKNVPRKTSVRGTPKSSLKNAKSESNLSPSKSPAVNNSGEGKLVNSDSTPDLSNNANEATPTLRKSITGNTRRVSLMDRQNSYVQKRRSMVGLPTANKP